MKNNTRYELSSDKIRKGIAAIEAELTVEERVAADACLAAALACEASFERGEYRQIGRPDQVRSFGIMTDDVADALFNDWGKGHGMTRLDCGQFVDDLLAIGGEN